MHTKRAIKILASEGANVASPVSSANTTVERSARELSRGAQTKAGVS